MKVAEQIRKALAKVVGEGEANATRIQKINGEWEMQYFGRSERISLGKNKKEALQEIEYMEEYK